jgi:hypothetical protein
MSPQPYQMVCKTRAKMRPGSKRLFCSTWTARWSTASTMILAIFNQIALVCVAHPGAAPIVELVAGPWPTRYGMKSKR